MYKVIGIQHRKYTNKSGKEVEGYNIFCTYEDKAVNGLGCLREWVNLETMEEENNIPYRQHRQRRKPGETKRKRVQKRGKTRSTAFSYLHSLSHGCGIWNRTKIFRFRA